ncbi:3-hydroxyisobutyrate dehydrogenase-like beta-hydroxyacid dehydrogenase [Paraburkholderia sp. MM5477-R1]
MRSVVCVGEPSARWRAALIELDALEWVSAGEKHSAELWSGDHMCILIASDVSPNLRKRLITGFAPDSNVILVTLADEDWREGDACFDTTVHVPAVSAALSLGETDAGRVFLSGDPGAGEEVASIFARTSLDALYCGSRLAAAQLISSIQHAICTLSRMVIIEAAGLGVRSGLPVDRVASVVAHSSGRSRQAELFFHRLLDATGADAGKPGSALKMLGYLVGVAMPLGLPLPLTAAATALLSLETGEGDDARRVAGDPFSNYERLVGFRRSDVTTSKAEEYTGGDEAAPPVIGYVGLGAMGSALAGQALRVVRELHVFDPDPVKVERLTREGARAAPDVASLAAVCDVIFLCVPSAKEVEQVLFGTRGMYASLSRGTIVIDQTTCSPADAIRFSERLAIAGVAMIDAPVTGGPEGARNGRLVTMCGAEKEAFSRASPILKAMGGEVLYFGEPGSGQAVKLVKNALGVGNRLVIYEMLSIAAAFGIRIDTLHAALSSGVSASGALDRILRSIVTGDPTADATLMTVLKDQQLIGRMGRATGAPLPMLNVARTVLEAGSRILGPGAQVDELGRLYGIESFQGIEKS